MMKRKSDFLLPYPYPHPYEDSGPTGFGFELQEPTSAPICSYHSSGMPNVVNEPEVGLKMKTKKQMCMSMSMRIQMQNIQYQMQMDRHFMAPPDGVHVPDDAMTLLSFSRNVQTNNALPINYTNSASGITNIASNPDSLNPYQLVEDKHQAVKNVHHNAMNLEFSSNASQLPSNSSFLTRYQDGEEKDNSDFQYPVEYAAGFMLRHTVLLPVLTDIINKHKIDKHTAKSNWRDVTIDSSEKDSKNSSNEKEISMNIDLYHNMHRKLNLFMNGEDIFISMKKDIKERPSESKEYANQRRYWRSQSSFQSSLLSSNIYTCESKDHAILSSWYDNGDKYLAYTSPSWSKWWEEKCCNPDPACEMVKLVVSLDSLLEIMPLPTSKLSLNDEVILGVAYYERNTIYHAHGNKIKNGNMKKNRQNITLIHGMRINPLFNLEARLRSQLDLEKKILNHAELDEDSIHLLNKTAKENQFPEYKKSSSNSRNCIHEKFNGNEYEIMTAMFTHVLFKSLLCGTSCLGVKSVKNVYMENIYSSYMGNPVSFHEKDGEKYFLLEKDSRFHFLKLQFEEQIELQTSLENE